MTLFHTPTPEEHRLTERCAELEATLAQREKALLTLQPYLTETAGVVNHDGTVTDWDSIEGFEQVLETYVEIENV